MDDYRDYDSPDEDSSANASSSGPTLPGGISMKTAATAVIIVALAAILWLVFVGPPSSEPPGLATSTAQATAAAVTTPATLPAPWTPGPAGAGAPAVTATVRTGSVGVATLPATVGAQSASDGAGTGASAASLTGLTEGDFVKVTGTGTDGIRYRFGPGLTYATIRIVSDGEMMRILGGPETSDGYDWYRLQDIRGNVGWAAREFVQPVAAPGSWSPPAASATFEVGSAPPTAPPASSP